MSEKQEQEQKELERRERMKANIERIKNLEKEVETKNNLVTENDFALKTVSVHVEITFCFTD